MGIETIISIGIAIFVAMLFTGHKKRKRRDGTTIIIENGGSGSGASGFKKIVTFLFSLGAGFAAAGVIIVFGIEPEIGAVDPESPLAIGLYLIMAMIIYAILRGLQRD